GTVATLATDGRAFALLDFHKNELARGPACPANVASVIRIPLAPADVAAIVLGDARRPEGATVSPDVAWDAERGADVLELAAPAPARRRRGVRALPARPAAAPAAWGARGRWGAARPSGAPPMTTSRARAPRAWPRRSSTPKATAPTTTASRSSSRTTSSASRR